MFIIFILLLLLLLIIIVFSLVNELVYYYKAIPDNECVTESNLACVKQLWNFRWWGSGNVVEFLHSFPKNVSLPFSYAKLHNPQVGLTTLLFKC